MGYCDSDSDIRCKKHWTRHPQPGICPGCLTESLLKLLPYELELSYRRAMMDCSSSDSSPSCGQYTRHLRANSDVMNTVSFIMNDGLSKSRSVVGESETRTLNNVMGREKKRGFWSKLFSSTGKRTSKVFGHSKAMRGRYEIESFA